MRTNKKLDKWHIDPKVLDEAVRAIESEVKLETEYDIPYTAGYSVDGKTIYIDKILPRKYRQSDGKSVDVYRYVMIHEAIEKAMLEAYDLPYLYAHQIASQIERDSVEADGLNFGEYDRFCDKYIKEIEDVRPHMIPKNLDLTPYIQSASKTELKAIENKMMTESASYKNYLTLNERVV